MDSRGNGGEGFRPTGQGAQGGRGRGKGWDYQKGAGEMGMSLQVREPEPKPQALQWAAVTVPKQLPVAQGTWNSWPIALALVVLQDP